MSLILPAFVVALFLNPNASVANCPLRFFPTRWCARDAVQQLDGLFPECDLSTRTKRQQLGKLCPSAPQRRIERFGKVNIQECCELVPEESGCKSVCREVLQCCCSTRLKGKCEVEKTTTSTTSTTTTTTTSTTTPTTTTTKTTKAPTPVTFTSTTTKATTTALPTIPTTQPPSRLTNKCGGAVNAGQQNCQTALWSPTGDDSIHCYAYGGAADPCALHQNNDVDDGLNKDPSACAGNKFDTFYLWDEPDTQGESYTWAGTQWAAYATKFSSQIQEMRQRGIKFTSPLVTAGGPYEILNRVNEFYAACGAQCSDPNSPAFIDVIAINGFCGPWNMDGLDPAIPDQAAQGCRGGAAFIVSEAKKLQAGMGAGLPVYITNWGRLQVQQPSDQLAAMDVIDEFFKEGSPVERVYWFGARDFGGGAENNFLTNIVSGGARDGQTLGEIFTEVCSILNK